MFALFQYKTYCMYIEGLIMTFVVALIVTSVMGFESQPAVWASDSKVGMFQDMADCVALGDSLYSDQAWECVFSLED